MSNRPRDLVVAMIVSRIIAPAFRLATAKGLNPMTATTSLGQVLGLGEVAYDELYQALDWLLAASRRSRPKFLLGKADFIGISVI